MQFLYGLVRQLTCNDEIFCFKLALKAKSRNFAMIRP